MIKQTFSQLHDTATMESDGRLIVYVEHVFLPQCNICILDRLGMVLRWQ